MKMPLISVIVPVWNRENTIFRAIQSVLESDYQNFEIIVSDNGSDDKTVSIIDSLAKNDPRIVVLKSKKNIGPVANWLKCVEHVSGEFVKVVWSDDQISVNTISELVAPMIEDKSLAFTYCKAAVVVNKNKYTLYELPSTRDITLNEFVTGFALKKPHIPVSPGCALLRYSEMRYGVELINDYIGECKARAIGPDVMLFYGALLGGGRGRYVSDTSVTFHSDTSSITHQSGRELINFCYDNSIIYILNKYKLGKYVGPYLVLRYFRSVVDRAGDRSCMEGEMRNRAIKALFSPSVFIAIWMMIGLIIKEYFTLNKLIR